MKRSFFVLAASTMLATLSCEDGPTQSFKPLPQGGRDLINAGDPAAYIDPATKDFKEDSTGTNKQVICTPTERRNATNRVFNDPILPFRGSKTVDLTVGFKYLPPLTIDDLEKKEVLCQAHGGSGGSAWGDASELRVSWNSTNHRVDHVSFWRGYKGSLELKDRKTGETFLFNTSAPATRNGKELDVDWSPSKKRTEWTTAVYNAVISEFLTTPEAATYAEAVGVRPEDLLPRETDCVASGKCIVNTSLVTSAYLWIVPTGTTIWVNDADLQDPRANRVFNRIEQRLVKISPFSFLPVRLEIDENGADVTGKLRGKLCDIKYGVTWKEFVDNCVKVTGKPELDDLEFKKLMTSLSHDSERFNFVGVFGTRMYFQNARLEKNKFDVTKDDETPTGPDKGVYLRIDQNTLGPILNDYKGGDPKPENRDNHGHGLQQLAYTVMVQDELNKFVAPENRRSPGDPACAESPRPEGCTGFEGYITAADPAAITDAMATKYPYLKNIAQGGENGGAALKNFAGAIGHGLKPAVHHGVWCDDPVKYRRCTSSTVWNGALSRVTSVMGDGVRTNLPPEFRDPRGFAKIWFKAMAKYFIAFGTKRTDPNLEEVLAVKLDPNSLFFDNNGQFDKAEYDIRTYVTKDRGPLNFEVVWDALGGIMNSYQFSAAQYRGERAFLASMAEAPEDPPGKTNSAIATNVFGSSVLNKTWKTPGPTATKYKTAYQCASAMIDDGPSPADPSSSPGPNFIAVLKDCGASNLPPLVVDPADGRFKSEVDELGRPYLSAYRGAFAGDETMWNFAKSVLALKPAQIQITERFPFIRSAKVVFPLFPSPYNPDPRVQRGVYESLVPSPIVSDNTGFLIPIDPTRNRFIPGEELNFTGTVWDGNINLIDQVDDRDGKKGALTGKKLVASLETDEYDGEVFMCKSGGDLLRVRMFDTADSILDWITAHPRNDCDFVIQRYPADNSVRAITSRGNGVKVKFTSPRGGVRVTDCEMFATGL